MIALQMLLDILCALMHPCESACNSCKPGAIAILHCPCRVGAAQRRLLRKSTAAMSTAAQAAEEALRRIELVRAHGYEGAMAARFAARYQLKFDADWRNICLYRVQCHVEMRHCAQLRLAPCAL